MKILGIVILFVGTQCFAANTAFKCYLTKARAKQFIKVKLNKLNKLNRVYKKAVHSIRLGNIVQSHSPFTDAEYNIYDAYVTSTYEDGSKSYSTYSCKIKLAPSTAKTDRPYPKCKVSGSGWSSGCSPKRTFSRSSLVPSGAR